MLVQEIIDGVLGDWAVTQEEWDKTMARDADSVAKRKAPKYNLGGIAKAEVNLIFNQQYYRFNNSKHL